MNLTPLKQRRVFNSWGMGKSLVMYFLIGLKKEIQNFTYPSGFMIVGSLKKKKKKKPWSNVLTRSRLLPTHRVWEIGVVSISMFTFQRDGSPVLEEDIPWIVKLARDWEKIYIYFKEEQKEFTFINFLK